MTGSKLERTEQGYYYFRKHNGIRYELNEGVSIGSTQVYTSDILYIMLNAYVDIPCELIDWSFGCDDLEDERYRNDMIKFIDHTTDKWEKEHPEITQDILNGKYEEI